MTHGINPFTITEHEPSKVIDKTIPGQRWEFDQGVTDAFDDMLRRSIPEYDEMRRLCFDLGDRHVQDKTAIIDLGASRGEAIAPFVKKHGAFNLYCGVEVSQPMLVVLQERFKGMIDAGIFHAVDLDLRKQYPPFQASLTLCTLTLQFTPIEHRQRIVRDAFKHTTSGGAMILVEKVLGSCAETDSLMNRAYWDLKEANGYGKDDIERKRLSLEGVLVPVSSRWNEDLLHSAGFQHVECFWRNLCFCGWIAIKD